MVDVGAVLKRLGEAAAVCDRYGRDAGHFEKAYVDDVQALLAERDRLRTAITQHREAVEWGLVSTADRRLWSVLEEPSDG